MLPTYNNIIHFDGVMDCPKYSVHVVAYGDIVFVGNRKGENHWWHYVNKKEVIGNVLDFMLMDKLSRKLVFVFFKRWDGGDNCGYHLIESRVIDGVGLAVGSAQICLNRVAMEDIIEAMNNESKHLKI